MADAARRERQDAVLAELSELGLTLARDLHARALAAESPQDADRLALAFQRVSRGVRQTFALELKIDRDRRACDREMAVSELEAAVRLAREAEAEAKAAPPVDPAVLEARARVGSRKDRVKGALNRLIWTEAEGDEDEYDVLTEDLDHRLGEAARRRDFLDLPLETLILQLKADMGLKGALRLTACSAPPPDPQPDPDPGPPPRGRDLVYDTGPPDTG